jgi:hypothetical protein
MPLVKYQYQIDSASQRAEGAPPRFAPQAEPVVTFDLQRIEASLASGFVRIPSGLSREARRKFILEASGKQ